MSSYPSCHFQRLSPDRTNVPCPRTYGNLLAYPVARCERFEAVCKSLYRRTLLEDVRKHSDSLLHPALATKAVQADGESEGGSKYWRELTDTFFVRGAAKGSKAQDDMMFFVRKHVSIATFLGVQT